jgi:ribosomal protein S18 acetylase RimI-like enzyme
MSFEIDPKLSYKRVVETEASELCRFIKQYYAYDHIDFDEQKVLSLLPALLADVHQGLAYFVNLDDQTIGYFILTYGFDIEFGGRHAVVTDLFFTENARRSGAGKKTLEFIQSLCETQKITNVILQVETDNEEAQFFYQRFGFKKLSRYILARHFRNQVL